MVWVRRAAPAADRRCSIPAGDGTRQKKRQETFSKSGLKSLGSVGFVAARAEAEPTSKIPGALPRERVQPGKMEGIDHFLQDLLGWDKLHTSSESDS